MPGIARVIEKKLDGQGKGKYVHTYVWSSGNSAIYLN